MRSLFTLFLSAFLGTGFCQDLNFVKEQVDQLTDSSFYGRGYVQNGSNIAANYIANSFKKMGVKPVDGIYLQPFDFVVNSFPQELVVIADRIRLVPGAQYIVSPMSGPTSGKYKTVRLDSSDFQGPCSVRFGKKQIPLIDLKGIDSPDEVAALHTFKKNQLNQRPILTLRHGKTTWSVGQQHYKYAEVEIDATNIKGDFSKVQLDISPVEINFEANNVIGKIPGARSDSSIVITAHFDHLGMMGSALFPGANDNASGVATMLDLVQYYQVNPPEFDTYFIGFAGEEAGLLGSKYFVDHPLFELNHVKLLINLDLMGSAAEGITVVNGKLYPEWMTQLSALNTELESVPKIKLRGKAANSDHYWFSERGVPAIFIYTLGNAKAYHDVNDKPQGLDWENYNTLFTLMVKFISQL